MAVEDPTKKQIEEVDPEVAEIIGLEDTFDLDQEDYVSLLKEKMVESRMNNSKFSSEQTMKITEEYKKVKNAKGTRFTTGKKGVKTESFFNKKPQSRGVNKKPVTDPAKLLPGSGGALAKKEPAQNLKAEPEQEPEQEQQIDDNSKKIGEIEKFLNGSLLDIVKEIRGLADSILSILQKQSSADKKGSELSRREREKGEKGGREKDLEKKEEKKGLGLIEKITKPFTSIFDTIKNFLLNVLMGSLVNWLWSVLENPMILLKPIQGLIDGITGFFNTVIQFIDKMVVQPVRTFIDAINSALNSFIGLLNSALKMLPGSPQIGPANIPNIPQAPELQAPNITGEPKNPEPKPAAGPPVNLQFTGGEVRAPEIIKKSTSGAIDPYTREQKQKLTFSDKVSNEGGNVNSQTTSFDVTGLGPDKHLTALSTGEYVLKKGAADWLGGPVYLDKINNKFGGTTERRVANLGDVKIQAASTGGVIGSRPGAKGGGPGPGSSSPAGSGTLKVLAKNAKTTYYDPSLGGINASGYKTKEGLPATSTGEGYRANVFSAAAFPPMIAKLPSGNLANASGFPGGKTLKVPLNVVVTGPKGNRAVVRLNDVGPGVKGHKSNHMLDFSVAAKNFFGTGEGFTIEGPTSNKPGALSGSAVAAADIAAAPGADPGASSGASSGAAPDQSNQSEGNQITEADYNYVVRGAPAVGGLAIQKPGPKGGPTNLRGSRPGQNNKVSQNPAAKFIRSTLSNTWNSISESWKVANKVPELSGYSPRSSRNFKPTKSTSPKPTRSSSSSSSSSSASSTAAKPQDQRRPGETPMQQWARLHPKLAAQVKPGQAGYEEISAMRDKPGPNEKQDQTPTQGPTNAKIDPKSVEEDMKRFSSKVESGEKQQYTQTKPEAENSTTTLSPDKIKPTTPLIPSSSASEQDLNKMSVDQLSKMLDPTITGNSNKAVWEASQRARSEGKAQGLTGEALEKKVLVASVLANRGGGSTLTPASVASVAPGKPPTIPGTPDSQPNVSMLPLPSMTQPGQQKTGMTKTGSTPVVYFESYDVSENTIVTTATLYNIWGM
jgi:hypothetical protein